LIHVRKNLAQIATWWNGTKNAFVPHGGSENKNPKADTAKTQGIDNFWEEWINLVIKFIEIDGS
jgi:hypothetical protein